ncbi:hypothetical protein CEXT_780361 [Caerostris extrusa]|uniref:Uncharacterized protein n=1 Tax=Caerostris extrusa TaxID=172846 RepID=A0AAV4TBF7_CAEEX|nr:hypothetical protein CEXT_780361 [Caerostris extrusa]
MNDYCAISHLPIDVEDKPIAGQRGKCRVDNDMHPSRIAAPFPVTKSRRTRRLRFIPADVALNNVYKLTSSTTREVKDYQNSFSIYMCTKNNTHK